MTINRLYLLLVLALASVTWGCGVNGDSQCQAREGVANSVPVNQTLTNYFNVNQLAKDNAKWTFQDTETGDYTYFEFSQYDHFGYSDTPGAVMHITKSSPEAYWFPGKDAEVWQAESDDGKAVWSPGVIQRRGEKFITYEMFQRGEWEPYYYLPDTYSAPFYFKSEYHATGQNTSTMEPITSVDDEYSWPWRIGIYTEQVSTPIYTGLAVVSHQCEGTHDEYEEKWKFAPGLGLVEIETLREHGDSKRLTIQRVKCG